MSSPATLPTRLMLRPGLRMVRRDAATTQLGLDTPDRTAIVETPATDAALTALRAGEQVPQDAGARAALAELVRRDLAVDARGFLEHRFAAGGVAAPAPDPHTVASVLAEHAGEAEPVLARRAATRVAVFGDDGALAPLVSVLRESGLVVAAGGDPSPIADAQLVVAVRRAEIPRGWLDPLMQRSVPHVLLAVVDGSVRTGPFVVPGRTACLRCLDARRGEDDPRHPLLVEQYAASGPVREDGVPEPVDPGRWAVAVAVLARDVVRYVDGRTPSLWSATLTLGPEDTGDEHRRWRRHPHCGCSWTEDVGPV